MAVIQTPDYFGSAFAQAFAQSRHYAEREAERKRQEEQNKAIAQMYLESMRAPADAAVSPYQTNAIQSQDDAFRKQMVAESSAMTDSLMANNPNFTQRIQGQTAPVTPEQAPELQQQFQQTNQANLSQANNQAQSAEQMLAMAKEKYGTAMFDRLAPIVASGKVPAQAMISIIEKQVQTAEKQAVKQATANAVKILSDPKADPAQKQGVLAQLMIDNPQAARGMAEAFGLKPVTPPATITPGSYVRQADGSYVQMGQSPNQVVSANTVYTQQQENIRAAQRLQDKEPKKPEWEKEHHDYEKKTGIEDMQLVQRYWSEPDSIDPKDQPKYNAASARVNGYLSQRNLTADEQQFLSGIDTSKVSKEEGFKMLQQYRMNKLNGIRQ